MPTSSGGGGSPAPGAGAVVYDNLVKVRERAVMLQTMLQGTSSPSAAAVDAGKLMEGMMTSLSSALSALNASGGGGGVAPPSGASGGRRNRSDAVAGPHRRSTSRRRSKIPLIKTVTATTLDDGNSWRKYGHKRIQESTNPRSYYRCSHRPDQGCMATKQVQQSETNPSEFIISYFGKHTCRDLSTIPLIIDGAAAVPPPDCTNLISFATSTSTAIGAASTSAGGRPYHSAVEEPIDYPMLFPCCFDSLYGSPPALQECASGGALSSSLQTPGGSPFLDFEKLTRAGRLIGAGAPGSTSTLTVGSAPAEYWTSAVGIGAGDMVGGGGGGTGSFPSSPSSLGFMTGSPFGSFGNTIGDDDFFGFDS